MGYQQTYNLYATTSDLWQMTLPPDTLFCDGGTQSGQWNEPVKMGTSTGLITFDDASNPKDDFVGVIKCVTGGELNVDGVINAGPPPTFSISLDNGVTFSPPLSPRSQLSKTYADGTNIINFRDGGFRLLLVNGTAPSYVANDTWQFTTSASPDLIRALRRASRFVENYLQDTYQLPYTSWDDDLRGVVCDFACWYLIKRRGLHQKQDMEAYEPTESMKWLENVGKGNIQPAILEKNAAYYYPEIVQTRPPYLTFWRY